MASNFRGAVPRVARFKTGTVTMRTDGALPYIVIDSRAYTGPRRKSFPTRSAMREYVDGTLRPVLNLS